MFDHHQVYDDILGKERSEATNQGMSTVIAALEAAHRKDTEAFRALVEGASATDFAQAIEMFQTQVQMMMLMTLGPNHAAGYDRWIEAARKGMNEILARPAKGAAS